MNADTTPELIFLVIVAAMLWTGVPEVLTGKIKIRHYDKYERMFNETIFADPIVIYTAWVKLLWSIPLAVFGVQGAQKIHPNVLDALNTLVKRFVNTDDKVIFVVILGVSCLILLFPFLMARMYGDKRKVWR